MAETRMGRLIGRAPQPLRMVAGTILLLMAIRGAADDGLGVVEWSGAVWTFTSSQPVWIVFAIVGLFLMTVDLWAPHVLPHLTHPADEPPPSEPEPQEMDAVLPDRDPEPSAPERERVFVPSNITPEYLADLFDDRTDLQAKGLVEPYIGKWMKVSGPLGNVSPPNKYFTQVTLKTKGMFDGGGRFETHGYLYMYFKPGWEERLAMLRPDTSIAVVGRLKEVNWVEVHLEHCELVDEEDA